MPIARMWIVAAVSAVAFASLVWAQDLSPKNRQELKRADLTGTNMEVIISVIENQPGETIPLHIHHGEEAFYVLQGAMVETSDGKQRDLYSLRTFSTLSMLPRCIKMFPEGPDNIQLRWASAFDTFFNLNSLT